MTWKQKTTIAILLLVARMLSDDEWKTDIKNLATSINVYREPKPEDDPVRGVGSLG